MYNVENPSIDRGQADHLAENILTGRGDVPEIGLTRAALRKWSNPGYGVQARCELVLSGLDPKWKRRCIASVNAMEGRMSMMTARLLAHARCDPFAWLVLSRHVSTVTLPGPMGGMTIVSHEGDEAPGTAAIADPHVHIGRACHWIGEGTLDVELPVPDTALVAAVGRPLVDLFSHPALNAYDLVIEAIDDNGGDGHLIRTNYMRLLQDERSIAFADMDETHAWPPKGMGRRN